MVPEEELEVDDGVEDGTILHEFRQQVDRWGTKHAIIWEDETMSISYLKLQSQSRRIAQQLKSDSNKIIAILLPCGFEHILSVFAVLEASKTFCPLSVDYPSVTLTLMLQELGNPLLITTKDVLTLKDLEYDNTYFIDAPEHENPIMENIFYEIPTEAEIGAVYFTSGSTGMPKAAMLRNKVLVRFSETGITAFEMDSEDESVCILNPGFALNIFDTLMILLSGGTIHIAPNDLRYDIPKLREWVKTVGKVTFMLMVTSTGEKFFDAEPEAFSPSLRMLVVAGEKLQTRPRPDKPFKVFSAYGSTESTAISVTEVTPEPPLENPVTHTIAGTACPGVDIYILDEKTLKPLPTGKTGEIAVASRNLFDGYLNRPAETAKKLILLENGARVCRLGDLGYMQPDGILIVLNRTDNQVKVAGVRFDPSELEAALLQHADIDKAVAVLEKLDTWKWKFHLFYQAKGKSPLLHEIRTFLQKRVSHFAFPQTITEVNDFPRNAHGKVDKRALLLESRNKLEQETVEPLVTISEKIIAGIWSELLGIPIDQISRTANFYALGGTSTLSAKVTSKLKEHSNTFHVQAHNIVQIPKLSSLAEYLDKMMTGELQEERNFDTEVNSFLLDFLKPGSFKKSDGVEHILITGTTGYLGSALLLRLLEVTDAEMYCLIRANNKDEARERQDKLFLNQNILLDPAFYPRLHFITGNISMPFFGLSKADYNEIAGIVDQVYHCAAEVHWIKDYDELRTPNVLGTLEILKFVCLTKVKFLHYISTVAVLDLASNNPQLESRNIAQDVTNKIGYTQSKWVAEQLVWKAIDAGVPAFVYRPGVIGSHSKSRTFNVKDFITLLFQACNALRKYPNLTWAFPYSNVDFTVSAIIEISRNSGIHCSKAFHIFQNGLSFVNFYDIFENMGMKKITLEEWRNLVSDFVRQKNQGRYSKAVEMMELFLSDFQGVTALRVPFSDNMNISNIETMKAVHSKVDVISKDQQIVNFADAVFHKFM